MKARRLRAALVGLLCVSALSALSVSLPAAAESGWPLKLTVELNAETHNSHSVRFPDPRSPFPEMELRVTPWTNAANEVITWDVELLKYFARTGKPGQNLLAPSGNWHGLQPFGIVTADVEGKGAYPQQREIRRNGFRCVITVLGGQTKPSRVTPNLTVFESLRLEIELDVDQQKGKRTPQPQPRRGN